MNGYPSRSDIVTAMRNPHVSFKAAELKGGSVFHRGNMVIQYSGGYTTVFPFRDKTSRKMALRCWIADIGDAKFRSQSISDHLSTLKKPYFVEFKYIDNAILINGGLHPVVLMEWVDGLTLKEFIAQNINSPDRLRRVASHFKEMVAYFHDQSIAHGDLQHGNILVKQDDSIVVIDYDSMYVKSLEGMPDTIKGLAGYQHPSRKLNSYLHPKLDYFSELIIYLALLVFADQPTIWDRYYGTEDLLFTRDDFADPYNSPIITRLIQSSDRTIADLVRKLQEELMVSDVRGLRSLEELVIDKFEVAKDKIVSKWEKQPNKPQAMVCAKPDKENIIKKF